VFALATKAFGFRDNFSVLRAASKKEKPAPIKRLRAHSPSRIQVSLFQLPVCFQQTGKGHLR
jgi:hypothetical protein